jgi:hypothetical protein
MEANVEHHMGVYGGWESKFARSASPEPRGRAFAGPCVYVNVYDITDIGMCVDMAETMISLNKRLLGAWDGGIFHAGVELAGVEYSYGYCDRGTGVFTNDPLDAYGASHRSRVPMGRCGLDARAIERRLARLVALWQGNTYALLTRNCCHFCDALCAELGVGPIPAWVNGLARSVHGFTDFPAVKALVARAEHEHPALRAHHPVWKSNLQLDFNVILFECFDTSTSAVLRELDESNRFVQKSAESTSI